MNTADDLGFILSHLFSKSAGFFSRDSVPQNILAQIVLEFTYTKFSSNISVIPTFNFHLTENPFKIHSIPTCFHHLHPLTLPKRTCIVIIFINYLQHNSDRSFQCAVLVRVQTSHQMCYFTGVSPGERGMKIIYD